MKDKQNGVYFRKFLDSDHGSMIVISGVIIGLTFGIGLLLMYFPLFLELSEPYPMIFGILGLAWIPIMLIVLIMKDDHIFKRIYPDWGFEDMTEAFRSQQ